MILIVSASPIPQRNAFSFIEDFFNRTFGFLTGHTVPEQTQNRVHYEGNNLPSDDLILKGLIGMRNIRNAGNAGLNGVNQ